MGSCPRCGKTFEEEGVRFCPKCGLDQQEYAARQSDNLGTDTDAPCYRHPGVMTGLRCGRCERPVCTKCVILGPAGPRCKDCSKTDPTFRPGAIGLGAKRTVSSIFSGGAFKWYWVLLLGSLVFSGVRSCAHFIGSQRQPPPHETSVPEKND